MINIITDLISLVEEMGEDSRAESLKRRLVDMANIHPDNLKIRSGKRRDMVKVSGLENVNRLRNFLPSSVYFIRDINTGRYTAKIYHRIGDSLLRRRGYE